MRKFYDTEKIVKKILKDLPTTRNDDYKLYTRYWQIIAPNVKFIDFFNKSNQYNGATFKCVERCRRKIQEKYPELQTVEAKEFRMEQETEFKQYGLGMME